MQAGLALRAGLAVATDDVVATVLKHKEEKYFAPNAEPRSEGERDGQGGDHGGAKIRRD